MKIFKSYYLIPVLILATACSRPNPPELVPEKSNYTETSLYQDVMEVVNYARDHADNLHYEVFGQSEKGKDLPLLVFSDQVIASPEQAEALERPVIFVVGNIHSGEVEGKEALLRLILELTGGEHDDWLDDITLVLAPIFNADGNDMIDRSHRTNQNGPSGGVGTRANAGELNLNRDFTKLDTPEGRGLVENILVRWDPMLFMDLHTTNGSMHGYHLTYAEPLNPNTDDRITRYQREKMLPQITDWMDQKGWNVFYYGNFRRSNPEAGWYTYSPLPRYSSNYHGLRNRLGLLSETYAYVDYESRIDVAEDFVKSTIRYTVEHASEIHALKEELDADYRNHSDTLSAGIDFDYIENPRDFPLLISDLDTVEHEDLERSTYIRAGIADTITSKLYNAFRATETRRIPWAYALDNREGQYDPLVDNMERHGIDLFTTDTGDPIRVEQFTVSGIRKGREYEGRIPGLIEGSFSSADRVMEDWIIVPTANSNRQLIFYLLEPESNDGYVRWNMLGPGIAAGKELPIVKIVEKQKINLRPVPGS